MEHNQDSSVSKVTGYGLDDRGSTTGRGRNLPFASKSKPSLGSTQPLIQGEPGVLSMGVKQPRRECYRSTKLALRLRMRGVTTPLLHTPLSRGVQ
jgi:hypothetical protein